MLIISPVATPQRTPVFDALADSGPPLHVMYLYEASPTANWGSVAIRHPHSFVLGKGWRTGVRVFRRILKAPKVKVLVVFGYRGFVRPAAIIAARLRGIQIVTRSDSNIAAVSEEGRSRRLVRKAVLRVLFPKSTRVWTIGASNALYWKEYVGLRNTRLIPYSVPVLPSSMGQNIEQRTSDPHHLRFLFVGRLIAAKDVDVLIAAFKTLLSPVYDGWSLDIVGDGPMLSALQELARPDSRIHFHGACPYNQLDRFYHEADVFVLPSRREPWGLVINESMAFGLRVIASEQVGAAELIIDESVGATFPVGDAGRLADMAASSAKHLARIPVQQLDPTGAMREDLVAMIGATDAK